jgi:hypothetical protein
MLQSAFRSSDLVPENKIFWVHHYQHRLPHLAKVLFDYFPECDRCGARVRFEPAMLQESEMVELLREDRDFKHAVGKIPSRSLGA